MPEYLDDPSVLTKDKLRQELLAHSVEPPAAGATKDAYVQLYLKTLTSRNGKTTASPMDGFSSDEDLPPPPPVVHSSSRSSGRKAVRKTDKVQREGLDVAELTAEGLKDELLKYGVDAGPIVASTRRVYEKKLLRLLDESISHASPDLPPAQTETGANHNGHTDMDQFSDKEDEETRVIPEPEPEVIPEPEPLPEPIPLVERLVRSRGKTPVTTRTRSSQHNKTNDALEDDEVLNVKRHYRRSSYRIGPNNMCSVLGDEPQTRPLSSQAKTDPAPSPSRTSQRSSEDSAAVRRSSVVLKERQPPTAKTPQIKPSEAPPTQRLCLFGRVVAVNLSVP
ncbi:Lamina-associated polypeptide 2, isoforms beta/delta/epsilon/gamma [Merluccius polli]|uniref:Lamina-associated polypeptide 2, isoforms beta/delta/epsilon/gamma n=1 Tax=Merluccius polli TaxID=89951 RepID=A0AA47MMW4_MERPO|nr:Lamina-associated polypeptide 2, isoforms beta/delta/epsilon/gamma [Merluccius polli]